jgi:hypothetical protein
VSTTTDSTLWMHCIAQARKHTHFTHTEQVCAVEPGLLLTVGLLRRGGVRLRLRLRLGETLGGVLALCFVSTNAGVLACRASTHVSMSCWHAFAFGSLKGVACCASPVSVIDCSVLRT